MGLRRLAIGRGGDLNPISAGRDGDARSAGKIRRRPGEDDSSGGNIQRPLNDLHPFRLIQLRREFTAFDSYGEFCLAVGVHGYQICHGLEPSPQINLGDVFGVRGGRRLVEQMELVIVSEDAVRRHTMRAA